ncbi:MAG: chitobiase/beta-hexosaminidase C-terminal domain-containing protein [Thomasclavelia ramosa]
MNRSFRIKNPNNEGQIYYTLDGTPPTEQSLLCKNRLF